MSTRGKLAVMIFFTLVCMAAPVVNYYLQMHREEVTPAELYQVVYNQLNAFRASDFTRAYSHASNGIRQKFNMAQFEAMIRQDYSGITEAGRIEFGIVRHRDQHALIQVFFIGRDGGVQPCIYSLIYEGESWKIDGARMLPRWPTGSQLDTLRS
jgi:Domain of unknown function (DUF4864)